MGWKAAKGLFAQGPLNWPNPDNAYQVIHQRRSSYNPLNTGRATVDLDATSGLSPRWLYAVISIQEFFSSEKSADYVTEFPPTNPKSLKTHQGVHFDLVVCSATLGKSVTSLSLCLQLHEKRGEPAGSPCEA